MCNHTYAADYKRKQQTLGKRCPYPEFYQKINRHDANEAAPLLPIDTEGRCIFHSRDINWKRSHDFEGHFLQLVQWLNAEKVVDCYDFAEFIFVGSGDELKALHIKDTAFLQDAEFMAASFIDPLKLENVDFLGCASFEQANFAADAIFANSRFHAIDASRAEFRKSVQFKAVEIRGYALFHATKFIGVVGGGKAVEFNDVIFSDFPVDFSEAVFAGATTFHNESMESAAGFLQVRFEKGVDFKNAQFRCLIEFRNASFAHDAEFVDVLFDTVRSTVRYTRRSVEFNNIEVLAGAVLLFESTDAQQKLFNSDVHFSFKEPPVGLVRFRNVNYFNFDAASRELLSQLSRSGHVEIGSGCIKYRLQTPIRSIVVDEGNAPLILELCQTFGNYFTVSNGWNLGFEVVERGKRRISFFYFTDEDISEVIFYNRLAVTEQRLWSLLAIRTEEQLLALPKPSSRAGGVNKESAAINAFDGLTAMLGTFFRVGVRIALGKWNKADTRALLNAIHFNDEDAEPRIHGLHRILAERYSGGTLLGINNHQHMGLPPMIIAYKEEPKAIDFAILTAIEVERKAICDAFGLTSNHRIRKEARVYWCGKLPLPNGQVYELVVAQSSDAANIDAALLTNDLLHHWRPGAALLVGIAASAKPEEVGLGDVVLGSDVFYHERGKVTKDGIRAEPKLISADATLWARVSTIPYWDGDVHVGRPDCTVTRPKVHAGVIASGEKVIADADARDAILRSHRKVLAIEMEGYGFSRAVWQTFAQVRHLDIRAICDDGSQDKNDVWHKYAAAVAAGFAKHFLLDCPLEPHQ